MRLIRLHVRSSARPLRSTKPWVQPVGEGKLDLLVRDLLIVELKTVDMLMPIHTTQLISYLKATGLQLGLLINFNVPVLKDGIKRIIHSQ